MSIFSSAEGLCDIFAASLTRLSHNKTRAEAGKSVFSLMFIVFL
jgi:hypothetical protein